ncbi:MAG: hypothetical protein IIC81_00635 [Chloroflexi bacterium]|nr:hypothetical protein [Chloroflexota bacterium]
MAEGVIAPPALVEPGSGTIGGKTDIPLSQHRSHPRDWRRNLYVYPVISRRSRGLSLGINLNPDTACNFDCVYCQVDRTTAPRVRDVDPARISEELTQLIAEAKDGTLFDDPAFAGVPAALQNVKDIAFSGDGEPTTCPVFCECVEIVAAVKKAGIEAMMRKPYSFVELLLSVRRLLGITELEDSLESVFVTRPGRGATVLKPYSFSDL